MGRFFSSTVETALRDIYYQMWTGRGKEALQSLEQASAAGDGDASCVLARCYSGEQYVWDGHGFPEDGRKAASLLRRSVKQGSALGVLICLRSGVMTPALEEEMPFDSLQEAFDAVLEKARAGEPFCQYTVGNVYFWWDFLRIQGKSQEDFPSRQAFRDYLKENIAKCEDWFWKAFRGGVYWGGINLKNYYQNGAEDLIRPQPAKAVDIDRIGAEYGYPYYQYFYALGLKRAGKKEEAYALFRKAADCGEKKAYCDAGFAYYNGWGGPKDAARAAQCFAGGMELPINRELCAGWLGIIYFRGEGVEQDYAKAFQLLKWTDDQGTQGSWLVYYLGACCANGWGTVQDYEMARRYLERVDWNCPDGFYLLGYLYANGLGGPQDIQKGVQLLQKAGDHSQAKEELKHYKKTFFGGKWVRR